jgi:hypothetical protein
MHLIFLIRRICEGMLYRKLLELHLYLAAARIAKCPEKYSSTWKPLFHVRVAIMVVVMSSYC